MERIKGMAAEIANPLVVLNAGADPNEAAPEHGNTLLVAAASGHEPLSLLLLKSGADPDVEDANGITALHYSVANGLAAGVLQSG